MANFDTCTYTASEPLTSSGVITLFLDIFDEKGNYIPNYYSGTPEAIKTLLELGIPNYGGVVFLSGSNLQIVKTPYELTNGAIDYGTSATPFTFSKTSCSLLPLPGTSNGNSTYELFSVNTLHQTALIEIWVVYGFLFFLFLKKIGKTFL